VLFRLPADVSYFEQPQVARWEPSKNHWRLDGLSDIQFNDRKSCSLVVRHGLEKCTVRVVQSLNGA
jgi:hypothetical protein